MGKRKRKSRRAPSAARVVEMADGTRYMRQENGVMRRMVLTSSGWQMRPSKRNGLSGRQKVRARKAARRAQKQLAGSGGR